MRVHVFAILLLLLALVLIYGRCGSFGYVDYDDADYVLHTEPVRVGLTLEGVHWAFTTLRASNWHPLTWISHMVDVSLFGLAPGPAHLENAAYHGINSVLVYALALALLRSWPASLLVAFLFLAHPLHVESVAWIAERKDVLCALFFLLSTLAYLRYAALPGARRYALVVLAFVLALLSKPMAVTLPVVLLLLDFWPLGRWRSDPVVMLGWRVPGYAAIVVEKLPLFALSLASGIVTLAAQKAAMITTTYMPLGFRVANALVAYATYLHDTVAPTRLSLLHSLTNLGFLNSVLPALLLLGAISAAAVVWRKRYPWLLFGWLWFLLTLLPVIGLIQVGPQSHADRYMYLPSIGLFMALGAALSRLGPAGWKKASLVLVPALVFYAFMAWVQVGYWSGPYMLFTRALEIEPGNFVAHVQLANFYLRTERIDKAQAQAARGLALSSGASGYGLSIAYTVMGLVLDAKKDYSGAVSAFRKALRASPHDPRMMNNLAVALKKLGRLEESKRYFAAAAKADPKMYRVKPNLPKAWGAD